MLDKQAFGNKLIYLFFLTLVTRQRHSFLASGEQMNTFDIEYRNLFMPMKGLEGKLKVYLNIVIIFFIFCSFNHRHLPSGIGYHYRDSIIYLLQEEQCVSTSHYY